MTDRGNDIDVTDKVVVSWEAKGIVLIDKCACGIDDGYFDFIDRRRRDNPAECGHCGRKLYIVQTTKVFEVCDDPD